MSRINIHTAGQRDDRGKRLLARPEATPWFSRRTRRNTRALGRPSKSRECVRIRLRTVCITAACSYVKQRFETGDARRRRDENRKRAPARPLARLTPAVSVHRVNNIVLRARVCVHRVVHET